MIQQLKLAINALLDTPFGDFKPNPQDRTTEISTFGLSMFDLHHAELSRFRHHYYGYNDADSVFIYTTVKYCSLYIFESFSDLYEKEDSGEIPSVAHLLALINQEYSAIRDDLTTILGVPMYTNDSFWSKEIPNLEPGDWKRHDVPLERQLVDWMTPSRLSYWQKAKRAIFLSMHYVDKEEPIAIELGCAPMW